MSLPSYSLAEEQCWSRVARKWPCSQRADWGLCILQEMNVPMSPNQWRKWSAVHSFLLHWPDGRATWGCKSNNHPPQHTFDSFTAMLAPVLPPGTQFSFGVAICWGRGRGIRGKRPYSSAFFPLCPSCRKSLYFWGHKSQCGDSA